MVSTDFPVFQLGSCITWTLDVGRFFSRNLDDFETFVVITWTKLRVTWTLSCKLWMAKPWTWKIWTPFWTNGVNHGLMLDPYCNTWTKIWTLIVIHGRRLNAYCNTWTKNWTLIVKHGRRLDAYCKTWTKTWTLIVVHGRRFGRLL